MRRLYVMTRMQPGWVDIAILAEYRYWCQVTEVSVCFI